ncbi:MAG TPA: AAA family ATPase, partial [Thermoanaerobaculia bacterium]|nr:AAA family ATPase [Thermoanaerobaculia bacterium]
MIQNFTIKNFKSFREATLPLAPLTVLIGANASGKSNAVEAIQLLSWLTSGRSLNDLLYAVREEELFLRGGFADLSGDGGDITLGCKVTEDPGRPPLTFSISLQITEQGPRIADERVLLGTTYLYSSQEKAEKAGRSSNPRFETIMEELREQHSEALSQFGPLSTALSSTFFLDPDPRRMREYSFIQEKRLKRDGSALSSVLRHLTEDGRKAEILEIIRSVPEQDISDITYLETPRAEVMVQLHETFGGRAVPREAALLSDGTLRVLAVAA